MEEKQLPGTRRSEGMAGTLLGYFSRLRFPWLFGVVAALFCIDLAVPDMLPFVDELLLGVVTIILARWRKQKQERVIDVRPMSNDEGRMTKE